MIERKAFILERLEAVLQKIYAEKEENVACQNWEEAAKWRDIGDRLLQIVWELKAN